MFDHIKIEGFRSFKKVELDLAPLSVLIGPNNGGKSNFLDLMSLMAEAGQGQLEKGIDSRGGFPGVGFNFGGETEISLEFRFQGKTLGRSFPALTDASSGEAWRVRFKLWLSLGVIVLEEVLQDPTSLGGSEVSLMRREGFQCVFRSVRGGKPDETEDPKTLESAIELAIFQVRDLFKYPTPARLLENLQQWTFYRDIGVGPDAPMRLPRLVRPTARLTPDGANLSSVLNSIQQQHPGVWEEIIELIRTAYPDFKTITFPPEGGDGKVALRWWEPPFEKQGVSANFLSDGTLKFLCLVAILKSPDPPPLICIDEPELGLHPDWVKLVAEMMQSAAARTQLIVATHSPQIVAKLDPEQVVVTEKENGQTHLRRLERRELEKWLTEFSLSELWLAGHFGGRP